MVDIVEDPVFASVPLLNKGEKIEGGDEASNANKQAAALVKRTAYLKEQLESLIAAGLKVIGTLGSKAELDAIDTTGLASGSAYFTEGQLWVWNTEEWIGSGSLLGPRGITLLGTWPANQDLPDVGPLQVGDAYLWKGDINIIVPAGDGTPPPEGQETPPPVWSSLGLKGPAGDDAYIVAKSDGFVGTKTQWLASLVGKSAYQSWLDNGHTGTEADYVEWTKANDNYQVWLDAGHTGTRDDFLATLVSVTPGPAGPARGPFEVMGSVDTVQDLPTPGDADKAYYIGSHLFVWVESETNYIDLGSVGGLSAYELWLAEGHTGDIDAFFQAYKSTVPGPKGADGRNLNVKGTLASSTQLSNVQNPADQDAYAMSDTGHLWILIEGTWTDVGPWRGKSNYEIYTDNGGTDDVETWLGKLKGKDGANGISLKLTGTVVTYSALPASPNEQDVYAVQDINAVFAYVNAAWQLMGTFKGEDGTPGQNGSSINIIMVLTPGNEEPPAPGGNGGNAYVDLVGHIHLSDGTKWVDVGPVGAAGPQGEQGTGFNLKGTVFNAAQLPHAQDAANGDAYLTSTDKMMYILVNGNWAGPFDLVGPQGNPGEKGEKGDPGTSINILDAYNTQSDLNTAHPTGNLGDGYLIGTHLWIWTTADGGKWIDVGEVRGPQGIQGPQGIPGKDSKVPGPRGTVWITLPVGQDAPSQGFAGNIGDWAVSSTFKVYYRSVNGWIFWGQLVAGDVNSPLESLGKVVRLGNEWVALPVDEAPAMISGKAYVRQLIEGSTTNEGEWVELEFPPAIQEPTADGKPYMRVRANGQAVGTWALYTAPTLASLGGVALSELGVSVAQLVNGTVPASQLPSYVDDVLDFDNRAAFPATGEKGKIYVADDTNAQYRWTGSAYIGLVASPGTTDAVVEGTTNLYYTPARVRSTPLAGIDFTAKTAITSSDTVLTAMGKLQAQITAFVPGFSDVPTDTNLYLRKGDHTWVVYTAPAAGISAPAGGADGKTYVYKNNAWVPFDYYDLLMVAATTELDLSTARVFSIANSSARTLTFKSGTLPGATRSATIVLIINGAGVITWPSNIVWNGGAQPTLGATTTVVTLLWDGIGNRFIGSAGATI